jgi:hypothetical protein
VQIIKKKRRKNKREGIQLVIEKKERVGRMTRNMSKGEV